MKEKEIDLGSIIAQIRLGAKIAEIALECPRCHKAAKELIEDNNNSPVKGRPSFPAIGETVGETNVILSKDPT